MNAIIFPIKNTLNLDGLCLCFNCGKLFLQENDPRDYGICSWACGYQFRGISEADFL